MELSPKSTSMDDSRHSDAFASHLERTRTLLGRHEQQRLSLPQPPVDGSGEIFGDWLPEATFPRMAKRPSLDTTFLRRGRAGSVSSVGTPTSPKKKTLSPIQGSVSPKNKSAISGHATVTRARAPVLQTELRANRHKQNHPAELTSKTLPNKHKSRPSTEKVTSGVSHLEDLFYTPPDRKTKATLIQAPALPKAPSRPLEIAKPATNSSPARSDSSFTTALEPVEFEVEAVAYAKDPVGMDIWEHVSVARHAVNAGDSSPTPKGRGLRILTEEFANLSTQEDCKTGAAESLENLVSPTSEVSEASTATSSIEVIVERAKVPGQDLVRLPKESSTTPCAKREEVEHAHPSPLRAEAQEFVPGQAFSPSAGSWSNGGSSPVTNASADTTRVSIVAPMPMPILPNRWMASLSHGMTSPYRYVPPAVPSNGFIDPSRMVGMQRANWREKNPIQCEVLSLDPTTHQPAAYPGHTPLEWREMALAIADHNRKRNISPIPFGIDARARFFQPGKPVAPLRGGHAAPETTHMEIPCLCGNTDNHRQYQGENTPQCLHCGSPSHSIEKCEKPPVFNSNIPQHVTLSKYLQTAHWKQKAVAVQINYRDLLASSPFLPPDWTAPFTCTICPERHSNDEIAQVIECIVAYLRARGEEPEFDWKGFWVGDFSQCPTIWALRPVEDPTKLYLAFNPMGNVAIRELIVTAEEALKAGGA